MRDTIGQIEVTPLNEAEWSELHIDAAEVVDTEAVAAASEVTDEELPELNVVSDPVLEGKVETIKKSVGIQLEVTGGLLEQTMSQYRTAESIVVAALRKEVIRRVAEAHRVADKHIKPLIEAKQQFKVFQAEGERLLTEVNEVINAIRELDTCLPTYKDDVETLRRQLKIHERYYTAFTLLRTSEEGSTEEFEESKKIGNEVIVGTITPVKSFDDIYEQEDDSDTQAVVFVDEATQRIQKEADEIRTQYNNITEIFNNKRATRNQSTKELDELKIRIDHFLGEINTYMGQFSDIEIEQRQKMEEEIAQKHVTDVDTLIEAAMSLIQEGDIKDGIVVDEEMIADLKEAALVEESRRGHLYNNTQLPQYGTVRPHAPAQRQADGPVVSTTVDSVARMLTEKVEVAESIAGVVVSRSRVAFDAAKRLLLSDAASNGRHAKKTPGTALVTQSIGMLPRRDPEELPGEDPVLWGAGQNIEQPAWRTVK